jgi:hypothetical protein
MLSQSCAIQTMQHEDSSTVPVASNDRKIDNLDKVWPENDLGSVEFYLKTVIIESAIMNAIGTNHMLLGSQFPESYDEMLTNGLIPVIFENRYTGNPIINTEQYSEGDIYYDIDPANSTLHFQIHMGNQDLVFDPDLTNGEDKPWGGDPMFALTDGRSIKFKYETTPEMLDGSMFTAENRIRFGIPENDDARARIYILSKFIDDVMFRLGEVTHDVPFSINYYIEFLGDKNPSSWINPYTGNPIKEVGWFDVPLYYKWEPLTEPVPNLSNGDQLLPNDLAGNYAYKLDSSPIVDGELRSYALFYFKEPDGSISGYLCIGVGYDEFHVGSSIF